MTVAIVTGSSGLVGSEAVRFFSKRGLDIVGVDNDFRSRFFGPDASTEPNRRLLEQEVPSFVHEHADIRDEAAIDRLFRAYGQDIALVIHAAAQPSHDWAARNPKLDFGVNAVGTLVLLEATRRFAPGATFIFTSTNKVYGDRPNALPLRILKSRYEIDEGHRYADGIDESMSIDTSLHSLFGASKVAADILVQEYGRYFGMKTACFRGGCLTGPHHAGAELHGFLAYLMKCTVSGKPYRVFGYEGKQVRDNIHSQDLVLAFDHFFNKPRVGEVYNIGGGRASNCSMREAIELCEGIAGRELQWEYIEEHRAGDHRWWISDLRKFREHYPEWDIRHTVDDILREIYELNVDKWSSAPSAL